MERDASGREPLRLSRDDRQRLVPLVKAYFLDEREEELGDLGAGLLLDYMAGLVGPVFYDRALTDARAVVASRAETIDEEIFGLSRQDAPRGGGER